MFLENIFSIVHTWESKPEQWRGEKQEMWFEKKQEICLKKITNMGIWLSV